MRVIAPNYSLLLAVQLAAQYGSSEHHRSVVVCELWTGTGRGYLVSMLMSVDISATQYMDAKMLYSFC